MTVNLLQPGRIDTDRTEALDSGVAQRTGRPASEMRAAAERGIPVGRYGSPAEFGAVRCDGGLVGAL